MDKIKIGQFITMHRRRLGMTQAELAKLLGVSNKKVSRWERGLHVPNYDDVLNASELFGVSVEDFMGTECRIGREGTGAKGDRRKRRGRSVLASANV